MFVSAVNVVQARMVYMVAGQPEAMTIYCHRSDGLITLAKVDSLGSTLATWNLVRLRASLSNQTRLPRIDLIDLTEQNGLWTSNYQAANTYGTTNAPPLSQQASLVVRWRTGNDRVGQLGRTYVPGLPTSIWSKDHWLQGRVTGLLQAFGFLRTSVHAAGFEMCVVSRFLDNLPRLTAQISLITKVEVRPDVGSMYRRGN